MCCATAGGFFSKYFYMAVCMCVFWGKGHGFGMLCQEGRVTKKKKKGACGWGLWIKSLK